MDIIIPNICPNIIFTSVNKYKSKKCDELVTVKKNNGDANISLKVIN